MYRAVNNARGQTALEYLLLTTVSLVLILGVLIWSQSQVESAGSSIESSSGPVTIGICRAVPCYTELECDISDECSTLDANCVMGFCSPPEPTE